MCVFLLHSWSQLSSLSTCLTGLMPPPPPRSPDAALHAVPTSSPVIATSATTTTTTATATADSPPPISMASPAPSLLPPPPEGIDLSRPSERTQGSGGVVCVLSPASPPHLLSPQSPSTNHLAIADNAETSCSNKPVPATEVVAQEPAAGQVAATSVAIRHDNAQSALDSAAPVCDDEDTVLSMSSPCPAAAPPAGLAKGGAILTQPRTLLEDDDTSADSPPASETTPKPAEAQGRSTGKEASVPTPKETQRRKLEGQDHSHQNADDAGGDDGKCHAGTKVGSSQHAVGVVDDDNDEHATTGDTSDRSSGDHVLLHRDTLLSPPTNKALPKDTPTAKTAVPTPLATIPVSAVTTNKPSPTKQLVRSVSPCKSTVAPAAPAADSTKGADPAPADALVSPSTQCAHPPHEQRHPHSPHHRNIGAAATSSPPAARAEACNLVVLFDDNTIPDSHIGPTAISAITHASSPRSSLAPPAVAAVTRHIMAVSTPLAASSLTGVTQAAAARATHGRHGCAGTPPTRSRRGGGRSGSGGSNSDTGGRRASSPASSSSGAGSTADLSQYPVLPDVAANLAQWKATGPLYADMPPILSAIIHVRADLPRASARPSRGVAAKEGAEGDLYAGGPAPSAKQV